MAPAIGLFKELTQVTVTLDLLVRKTLREPYLAIFCEPPVPKRRLSPDLRLNSEKPCAKGSQLDQWAEGRYNRANLRGFRGRSG